MEYFLLQKKITNIFFSRKISHTSHHSPRCHRSQYINDKWSDKVKDSNSGSKSCSPSRRWNLTHKGLKWVFKVSYLQLFWNDDGEAPWSSGECWGLTIQAMVLGLGFKSRLCLKTRRKRWTTWWQKTNKNSKDSQMVQVTHTKKTVLKW